MNSTTALINLSRVFFSTANGKPTKPHAVHVSLGDKTNMLLKGKKIALPGQDTSTPIE